MPKRTAIIDLGSNSVRMAIFERTSRLGFFILREYKAKVRLGHGAYENGGILQQAAMDEVANALSEFKNYIRLYKVRKIIAGGTSALRDAPNAKDFVKRISNELGINLRIISGQNEAFYGALAALNLLPNMSDALCVDIGGGSTELAKLENGKITHTLSLNLGTVRLKELFYDKNDKNGANAYIKSLIDTLPNELKSQNIIAIGGSLRAISSAIISNTNYAPKTLHAFSYEIKKQMNFIKKLCVENSAGLKELGIKKDRFDTIGAGASIFSALIEKIGAKAVITSSVGIREGLFLHSILRPGIKFPANFNPSLKALQDRFCVIENASISRFARILFEVLAPLHKLGKNELELLNVASKIFNVGRKIGYYSEAKNSAYIVLSGLNYGYTHEQICSIASICELNGKDFEKEALGEFAAVILSKDGSFKALKWLCFLLGLARHLGVYTELGASYENGVLRIKGARKYPFLKETILKLSLPEPFAICFAE